VSPCYYSESAEKNQDIFFDTSKKRYFVDFVLCVAQILYFGMYRTAHHGIE